MGFFDRFIPWKGRPSGRVLGLEVRPDGLGWAIAEADGLPSSMGFSECTPAGRQEALASLVDEQGLAGARVRGVMSIDQYQVFQIDRPPVEDQELVDAVRWKIRDLIDFGVEEASVDVFPFPEDASRGRGELVNVVACRKTLVRELVQLCEGAELVLDQVDVAELALRNLAAGLDPEGRGLALIYLRPQHGQMVLCRGATLYLARRLDVTASQLADAGGQDQAIQNLALEIQRSMDYYESQLGQVPPRQVHLIGHDRNLPLTHLLGSNVAAEVVEFMPEEVFQLESLDPRAINALGAIAPVDVPTLAEAS